MHAGAGAGGAADEQPADAHPLRDPAPPHHPRAGGHPTPPAG